MVLTRGGMSLATSAQSDTGLELWSFRSGLPVHEAPTNFRCFSDSLRNLRSFFRRSTGLLLIGGSSIVRLRANPTSGGELLPYRIRKLGFGAPEEWGGCTYRIWTGKRSSNASFAELIQLLTTTSFPRTSGAGLAELIFSEMCESSYPN